jgi:hypothetical protein
MTLLYNTLLISLILIICGATLAYPIKWFNRSDVDNETLERLGIAFMSAGCGVLLCVAYITYTCGD